MKSPLHLCYGMHLSLISSYLMTISNSHCFSITESDVEPLHAQLGELELEISDMVRRPILHSL